MASPIRVRQAQSDLAAVGAVLMRTTAAHQTWRHPAWQRDFTLPTHGSKGRPTISPGMSANLRKALRLAAAT